MRAISGSWKGPAVAWRRIRRKTKRLQCGSALRRSRSLLQSRAPDLRPRTTMPERKPYALPPTVEKTPISRDPYAAFRFRGFVFFALGNFVSIAGRQMLTIAIEWEVYARTHSATALGLVGLVVAVPIIALSLPAGHLADRFAASRLSCSRKPRARPARFAWRSFPGITWPFHEFHSCSGVMICCAQSRLSSRGTRHFTSTISPCR